MLANELELRPEERFGRERNDRGELRLPDAPRRPPVVERYRRERRKGGIGRLDHDKVHLVGRRVVQDEHQMIEGNDQVKLSGDRVQQFFDAPVMGDRPRYA